jgi:Flp pilus assembly protein TadD
MHQFCRAAFLMLICLIAAAAFAENEWVEVRSPNFSVITDASEKRGRDIALRFEQMRYVFSALLRKDMVNIPVPLQIVAFRNTKEFREFMPLWEGKPVKASGLYQGGEDRNFIMLDLSVPEPYSVVFHEYAHLLLNGNYPRTQPWFDEGFAELYRTTQIIGKTAKVGDVADDLGHVLLNSKLLPVIDLFSITQDSKIYNERGDRNHLFYSQSWLVVHYLFDNNKLAEVGMYFNLTQNQNVPVAEAIQKAFGMSPRDFDKEIEKYLRVNRFRTWQFEIGRFEMALYKNEKLKPADAQAVLADVHLHSHDYLDKAIAEFQAILESQPDHAAAHRGLGYANLRKGDLSTAGEHFRRAAALDSNDARVHYYTALLMNRQALNEGGRIEQPDAMMSHLKRAIQIDANLADAYNLLAYVEVTNGSPAEALESIKTAIRLSPRNDYYYATLAQVYMAQRKWDDAETTLKRLESSSDKALAARSRSNLQRVAEYRQNVHLSDWADLKKRNEQKEWGTTPSQERLAEDAAKDQAKPDAPSAPNARPVKFVKGRLVSVACGEDGRAILTVTAGAENTRVASLKKRGTPAAPANAPAGKTVKLVVPDAKKVLLLGADEFSCAWRNQRVAINYHAGGEFDGEVMSVELQ